MKSNWCVGHEQIIFYFLQDIIENVPFDPDYYNPDGSLRTVHKMPDFNASYAEASKARYIRHTRAIENERELQTHEIFDKS